jgi:hypothetical protein
MYLAAAQAVVTGENTLPEVKIWARKENTQFT